MNSLQSQWYIHFEILTYQNNLQYDNIEKIEQGWEVYLRVGGDSG